MVIDGAFMGFNRMWENPYKWRFVAGKIIELNVMYVLRKLMKPGIFHLISPTNYWLYMVVRRFVLYPGVNQQRCGKTMWKTFGFPFEIVYPRVCSTKVYEKCISISIFAYL